MPDFNQMQRRRLAAKRQAMPDGVFPIRNISDLKNAIQAYGRAKNKPAVKAWIKKRARELGATNLLPDNWRDDILVHYGVKGMKWGVRRYQNKDGTLTAEGRIRYRLEKSKSVKNLNDVRSGSISYDELKEYQYSGGVMPKGSSVYRVTHSKDESSNGRKYVSFVDSDREGYKYSDYFLDYSGPNYEYTYEATKDLKIAGLKDAIEARLNSAPEFANKRISELTMAGETMEESLRKNGIVLDTKCTLTEAYSSVIDNKDDLSTFIFYYGGLDEVDVMKNTKENEAYFNYLNKKGFDGVLDVTDVAWDKDYPLIVINNDAIKVSKKERYV